MTEIDIFSGFLGAGKTTLIKKLIEESYKGEKIVLIENEFGEIGIDGGFMQDAGVQINEMNSGCICCSLVGDFGKALKSVIDDYSPDRILIEPSGVGKLSDVIKAASAATEWGGKLNSFMTVVDASKCKMYMKNFGEFFNDQIENAGIIVFSHTDKVSEDKLQAAVDMVREHNEKAVIITTPWDQLSGRDITEAAQNSLQDEIAELRNEHHHEHHHHDEDCDCHDHEHEHVHHHHDDDCDCGCLDHEHEHEHHHHDDDCDCGCHDHEHHHHHHADEVFSSWGRETTKTFTDEKIKEILESLDDSSVYGTILRAKGIVSAGDHWIHFDYVPGEPDVRHGSAGITGRICVIGSKIDEHKLEELFEV